MSFSKMDFFHKQSVKRSLGFLLDCVVFNHAVTYQLMKSAVVFDMATVLNIYTDATFNLIVNDCFINSSHRAIWLWNC